MSIPTEDAGDAMDAVIRLTREIAGLRSQRKALKRLIEGKYPDAHYSSLRGAVTALMWRIDALEELLEKHGVKIPEWK